MVKVAFISQPGRGADKALKSLSDRTRFDVREFFSMAEIQRNLTGFTFDVLVIRVEAATEEVAGFLTRLRARFPATPIITLAPSVDPNIRYKLRAFTQHRFLEDLEISDIAKVVEAVRQPSSAAARLHPRAARRGQLELVHGETGERVTAEFVDFAQMGARIRLSGQRKLSSLIGWQVHYPSSSEPGKVHRLIAKIVWEEPEKAEGLEGLLSWPRTLVGVRFVASL